jgi:lysozyme family protein
VTAFDLALAFTLTAEGGYVNDPADHGGATNKGITQATYGAWRESQKLPLRTVELLTSAETADIYRECYWNPGRCEQLPIRTAVVHFDWCVNHGVSGAIKTLQQVLGLEADGVWGPKTAQAVASHPDPYYAYINARRAWYTARVQAKPNQAKFLTGWLARCDKLQKYAEGLYMESR